MFKCNDCGAEFGRPKKGKELIGERFGEKCYEDLLYCPDCGSTELEEGEICKMCEAFGDWPEIANGFCEACASKSFTPEAGIALLEEKRLFDDFVKRLFGGSDYINLKYDILNGKRNIEISDVLRELKDYCLEDWREFAEVL